MRLQLRVTIEMKSIATFSVTFALATATLIAAGVSAPSWARDTDIYSRSDAAHSESTIKPNVLLVLDNSQSMLAPDGWKEYPGDYDPNVEYLWNYRRNLASRPYYQIDAIAVDSAAWQTQIDPSLGVNKNPMGFIADKPCDDQTPSAAAPGDITEIEDRLSGVADTCSPSGFRDWIMEWPKGKEGVGASEDWADRRELRNYDRRILHWLPAGTPETDVRLVSPSLNTFEADDFVDKGIRALIDFDDNHRRDRNYGTDRNRCVASRRSLHESGVLTPGTFFSQAEIDSLKAGPGLGKFLNRKWLRWDRHFNAEFSNEYSYPGPGSNRNTNHDFTWDGGRMKANRQGYIDSDRMPIRGKTSAGVSNWAPLRADGGGWRGINNLRNYSNETDSDASNRRVNQLLERLYPGFAETGPTAHPHYDKSHKWWMYAMVPNVDHVPMVNGEYDLSKFWAPWGYESYPRDHQEDPPSCPNPNSYSSAEGFLGTVTEYNGNVKRYYDESVAEQTCEGDNASIANGYCTFGWGDDRYWERKSNWKWVGRDYFTNEQGEVFGYGGNCVWNSGTPEPGARRNESLLASLPNGPGGASQPYWVRKSDENNYCKPSNDLRPYCEDVPGADNNCRFNRQCRGTSTTVTTLWQRGDVTWQARHDCLDDSDGQGLDIVTTNSWKNWNPRWKSAGDSRTIEAQLAIDPSKQIPIGYETRTGAEIKVKPPAIDVYSANYLNWKFGVKGPNGHPVGRMTRMAVAKKALSEVILENDGVRFGLMVFNSADNLGNADGGKVVFKVSDMTDTNRAALLQAVAQVEPNSSTPLAEAMYEAKLYFAGETPWKGTSESGYDTNAVVGGTYFSPMSDNPDASNPAQCQKNYSILVTDGDPEFDTDANTQITALAQTLSSGAIVATNQVTDTLSPMTAALSPNEPGLQQFAGRANPAKPSPSPDLAVKRLDNIERFSWLDELTYFMQNADLVPNTTLAGKQNVSNFVIGFSGANSEVLRASATFADDDSDFYTADSTESLKNAIQAALQGIRRWTPVRSAPVVGINSKNRAETGQDVYMAFFEPRDRAGWRGTLKRYKLYNEPSDSVELGNLSGVMCNQPSAVMNTAGTATTPVDLEVKECLVAKAQGTGNDLSLQEFQTQVLDDGTVVESLVLRKDVHDYFVTDLNFADEAKGDKGGTGWKLINDWLADNDFRKVYARIDTGKPDLTDAANAVDLTNKAAFATRFGLDAQRAEDNIKLARGINPQTDTRLGWMHGDILHSQPAVVHYDAGAATPTGQTLFYLSNDGLLRAVDASTGQELWAFLVDEALCKYQSGPNVSCVDANDQPTRMYERFAAENGSEHIVLADGPLVVDVHDRTSSTDRRPNGLIRSADGDRVTLVFGLRRGGRAYYALDVTDRTKPQFMWKKDPSSGGAFSLLGQSWSKPTLGKIRGYYDISTKIHKPVAIFAGGYDPSFDYDYSNLEDVNGVDHSTYPRQANLDRGATMGLGVYVLDLLSGDLVRWFGPSVTPGPLTNTYSAWNSAAPYKTDESKMKFAMPSDLVGLNVDLDTRGFIDTAYIGDMGGLVWRVNFDPMDPREWNVRQIANLSGDLTQGALNLFENDLPRAIFYPPAVVKDDGHLKIVIGTGAQELPLLTQTQDVVAMLKDENNTINPGDGAAVTDTDGNLVAPITYLNSTLDGLEDGFTPAGLVGDALEGAVVTDEIDALRKAQVAKVKTSSVKGWVRRLNLGEKVTGAPMVFNWLMTVPTWTPTLALNACTPAGLGRLRVFDVKAGAAAIDEVKDAEGNLVKTFKSVLGPKARGYVDNSTLIFQDGEVRQLINADGVTAQQSMTMGALVETEYWYRELAE